MRIFLGLILFLSLLNAGCSTYQADASGARNALYSGDYGRAASLLEKKANEDGKDQLLYLLDYALMLHYAGKYKESNDAFLKADRMAEIKDYTSLSAEAGALLTNENLKQYKGEDFEKILINVYLAMNYTLMGNYEDALVECRRVNEKLYKYKYEAKRNYEQNQFARYLSAVIWESQGKLDDAYVDYKNTQQIKPDYKYIGLDLETLAKRLGRRDDLVDWEKEYGHIDVPTKQVLRETGEIVLLYEQGQGPVKRPHPNSPRFPKFYPRWTTTKMARLEVVDDPSLHEVSPPLYSIQDIAIKNFDDAYAGLVAKRVAGVAVKAVVSDQIRQKSELLGILTWIGLNAMDQADLRHWSLLPESLQIARLRMNPGSYRVKVTGLIDGGQPSGEEKTFENVEVKPGKKTFLNWRSLH